MGCAFGCAWGDEVFIGGGLFAAPASSVRRAPAEVSVKINAGRASYSVSRGAGTHSRCLVLICRFVVHINANCAYLKCFLITPQDGAWMGRGWVVDGAWMGRE